MQNSETEITLEQNTKNHTHRDYWIKGIVFLVGFLLLIIIMTVITITEYFRQIIYVVCFVVIECKLAKKSAVPDQPVLALVR